MYLVKNKFLNKYRSLKRIPSLPPSLFKLGYTNFCFYWCDVTVATRYGLKNPGFESRWKRDFSHGPDWPWGPPRLLYNGYRVFPGGKGTWSWRWPPTPSSAWVKERLVLYSCSPSEISCPAMWRALPLTLLNGRYPEIWEVPPGKFCKILGIFCYSWLTLPLKFSSLYKHHANLNCEEESFFRYVLSHSFPFSILNQTKVRWKLKARKALTMKYVWQGPTLFIQYVCPCIRLVGEGRRETSKFFSLLALTYLSYGVIGFC